MAAKSDANDLASESKAELEAEHDRLLEEVIAVATHNGMQQLQIVVLKSLVAMTNAKPDTAEWAQEIVAKMGEALDEARAAAKPQADSN